jgi:hypothetical protein
MFTICVDVESVIPGNNVLVLPAKLLSETADSAVLASRLEPQHSKSLGNNDALLLVIWWGNTLEGLQAFQCGGATGALVGNHAADGSPEHLGWSAEMEGT